MDITICIEREGDRISIYEQSVGVRMSVPSVQSGLALAMEMMLGKQLTPWQQVKAWVGL